MSHGGTPNPSEIYESKRKCLDEIGSPDEMNLHVPQSIEAEIEIMVNSKCTKHILSAQGNGPVNGIVQDGLVASFILTMKWDDKSITMVPKKIALDVYKDSGIQKQRVNDLLLRGYNYYPEYILCKNGKYEFTDKIPGSLFYSIIFPPTFCYTRITNIHDDPSLSTVKIENGIVLPDSGPICKKSIGACNNSIIHILGKLDPEYAGRILSDIQQITDRWLPTHGFTMGISDCFANSSDGVAKSLIETRTKVSSIINKADTMEKAEADINSALNDAMAVGPILAKGSMKKLNKNSLNIMRNSGAKGSVINLAQIVAFVGQQNIKGTRMPMCMSHKTRCLPSFLPGDNSPDARGFVEDNYITGLTPQAAFFHAAAGRDGIISTALKTADTGYVQKRLARKMEDCKIYIDGTVRNANGSVISFLYGGDGMDPKKLVSIKGYDQPFFVNPINVARRLNSDAVRSRNLDSNTKPRKLKKEELDYLVSKISYTNLKTNVVKYANENLKGVLCDILKDVKLYEAKIPDFCKEIKDVYIKSKAQYGLMAGLIATSSIGEPTTQMVLNVFHLAGFKGKDASLGVPRFKELINITKTSDQRNPGCTIYLKSKEIKNSAKMILELENENKESISEKKKSENNNLIKEYKQNCLRTVQNYNKIFEHILVKDLMKGYDMKYVNDDTNSPTNILKYEKYAENWWSSLSKRLFENEDYNVNWILSIYIDVKKLYNYRIELDDIARNIEEKSKFNISCITSPNNIGVIEIYSCIDKINEYTKTKISMDEGYINDDNIEYFLCRDVLLEFIKDVQVSGINGISKIYPRENLETKEWVIDTDGINFMSVLGIPIVDKTRTVVDDMHSINSILGIEAARRFLFLELSRVISFDGTYINPRHLSMLADVMTTNGSLTAASRYGIGRDAGPNAKIMFEKPVDNAMKASVFGEIDNMTSLSSSVMYGKIANAGNGVVSIRKEEKQASVIPKVTDISQISRS